MQSRLAAISVTSHCGMMAVLPAGMPKAESALSICQEASETVTNFIAHRLLQLNLLAQIIL
jgi:hypothetical protein